MWCSLCVWAEQDPHSLLMRQPESSQEHAPRRPPAPRSVIGQAPAAVLCSKIHLCLCQVTLPTGCSWPMTGCGRGARNMRHMGLLSLETLSWDLQALLNFPEIAWGPRKATHLPSSPSLQAKPVEVCRELPVCGSLTKPLVAASQTPDYHRLLIPCADACVRHSSRLRNPRRT